MAGPQVSITIRGANEVRALLTGVQKRALDLTVPLKQGGLLMLRSVDTNFRTSGRPQRWKALKTATLRQKLRRGYSPMPLVRSGARGLQGSVSYDAGTRRLVVGTDIVYGRIHQKGGYAGRGHAAYIPARPYLVFQEDDLKHIETLVLNHITGIKDAG